MASPGDLDTSFNANGKKFINFGGTDDARAVLVQPNGRIVVAGGGAASDAFCVARLQRNGLLDKAFRSTGKRAISFGGGHEGAYAAALQPDGRILLAGDSELRVAVTRLNADGALDTSFSGDGKQLISWGPIGRAMAVLVLPNGRILLGGFSGPEGGNIEVARLKPGGALDTTFGTGGRASIDFGGTEFGLAMARQANGRIVIAGRASPGGAIVARLRANGSLDPDFDGDGRLTLSSEGTATAVLIQTDGRILVAGNINGFDTMTVTRLMANGSLDPTFGTGGTATIDFGITDDFANDAVLQADGRIVVAGYTQAAEDVAVARLNPDGSLDATFGAGGKATVDFGGIATFGNAVALAPNGRIVVAGQRSGADDFALARLLA
jgi:uncharacterized delta-60 repeat protein